MFNRISLTAAFLCLLIAGKTAAQDYEVHSDRTWALACADKEYVRLFVEAAQSHEKLTEFEMRAFRLAMEIRLTSGKCELYQSGMDLEIVAEDRADSKMVLVKRKDPDARLLWSYLPWFKPVAEESR